MEGENIPKARSTKESLVLLDRREFSRFVENHLVYAHFSLGYQISLQTVSSKSISKIFLLLFTLKENYCHHRRFLIWWKITKLLMHVHSLTYLPSPRHILTIYLNHYLILQVLLIALRKQLRKTLQWMM